MIKYEGSDPRFRAFLAERAPRHAPDALLHQAMRTIDGVPQQSPWVGRWPVLGFGLLAASAATVLVVTATALLLLMGPSGVVGPTTGPSATSEPSSSATSSPSPAPTTTPSRTEPPPYDPVPGLLAGPATCVNDSWGFSVPLPAGWYANLATSELPACTWLSRTPFDPEAADVALQVWIGFLQTRGDPVGREFTPSERQELTINGLPALREVGDGMVGPAVRYAVGLDGALPSREGDGLTVSAITRPGATSLEEAAAALDEIMAGFELWKPGAQHADVFARIGLPHSSAESSFPPQAVVTADAIWLTDGGATHLTKVDLTTNRVVLDVTIESSQLFAGADGTVWALSPAQWDAPDRTLSELDQATGRLRPVAAVGSARDLAIGSGEVWVRQGTGITGEIRVFDVVTGSLLRTLSSHASTVDYACGSHWTWRPDPGRPQRWYLSVVRDADGEPIVTFKMKDGTVAQLTEIGDLCWVVTPDWFEGMEPTPLGSNATYEPPIQGQLMIIGRSGWSLTPDHALQRIDPVAGSIVGPTYLLPSADLPPSRTGVPGWRLLSAGGSIWVLTDDELIRYDIPAA